MKKTFVLKKVIRGKLYETFVAEGVEGTTQPLIFFKRCLRNLYKKTGSKRRKSLRDFSVSLAAQVFPLTPLRAGLEMTIAKGDRFFSFLKKVSE